MEPDVEPSPYRPRVSRETRLLLTAAVLAIAALWVLARIRFPDRPASPNPVPPVLTQLVTGSKFADLAGEISQLQARLEPWLLALNVAAPALMTGPATRSYPFPALRIRDDLAVTLVPSGTAEQPLRGQNVVARDPASGLTVVRVPTNAGVPPPTPWSPRQMEQPRYLVANDVSREGMALRPVFIGSLAPVSSAMWSEPVWSVPAGTDLRPGWFLFTDRAELAGLVVLNNDEPAIVPGATLFAEAERLVSRRVQPAGDLGIRVQSLTSSVAAATGASAGVVVTWIDRNGPASSKVAVGDVIEAADASAVATERDWDVRLARLSAGETLTLRVRRRGELREVQVVASAQADTPTNPALGLTMRHAPGLGTAVVRVDRLSAADRAGLQAGDVITLVAGVEAPTPTQVRRAFAAASEGQPVLVAVTRGDAHHVMTLEK